MSTLMSVREAPGGGLGVFATVDLRQGDLIEEEITFKVDTTCLPGNNVTWRDVMLDMRNLEAVHVDNAMKVLDKDTLEAFRKTYSDATSDLQRFQIISYDICPTFGGPPSAFAATPIGPYMNHSCVANLLYSWDEQSQHIHLRATKNIAAGEQLYLCYMVDDQWMDSQARKDEMFLIYDFPCGCPLCGNPERAAASDSLREEIRAIRAKLEAFVKSKDSTLTATEASESADRYVSLVERELGGIDTATGLPNAADTRLASAYRLAAKCKQDPNDAKILHEKATKVSQICFGPKSPHVAMQDRLFEEWCAKK